MELCNYYIIRRMMKKSEAVSLHEYWQTKATEAILIKTSRETMNLDSDLQLPTMWNPTLNPP